MLHVIFAMLLAGPLDVEPDDLRPGLVAEYRSLLDADAKLTRIDLKPAFTLGSSSPHPRLPPGPFETTWTGAILLRDGGGVVFDAILGGDLQLEIDGAPVHFKKTSLTLPAGWYPFKLHFKSRTDIPARLQLWWQAPSFAKEPIPAWRFGHVVSELPAIAKEAEVAERGRALAGRLGCARCHASAFPSMAEPPPGPALHDLKGRVERGWLLQWLDKPGDIHSDARMPELFSHDRTGFVERWMVADFLLGEEAVAAKEPAGSHRLGQQQFLSLGCVACHYIPDVPRSEQLDLDRWPLRGLADRMTADGLAAFLANPHGRYPDGRMPRQSLSPGQARDVAAYLLMWTGRNVPVSRDAPAERGPIAPPTALEMDSVKKRLKANTAAAAGTALLQEKGCLRCHAGLGSTAPKDVAIADWWRGCLQGAKTPAPNGGRLAFHIDLEQTKLLRAFGAIAGKETHPSPFASRQRLLERSGCVRCHARDTDRLAPLEQASKTLGGAYLQYVPFQRTPGLTYPQQKFTHGHLTNAVREGVVGLRAERYTFKMPAFGHDADALVQALAEADGEIVGAAEDKPAPPLDATAGSLVGPQLIGFQGYSCIACHLWKGQKISESDPGNQGTDLTRVTGRLRREWFDRFLENPARFLPGTPMPTVFHKDKPATLTSLLGGDAVKQRDALWHYFAMGPDAPSPKPPPPLPVVVNGKELLIAQIPIRLPSGEIVESLAVLNADNDLFLLDLATGALRQAFVGGRILRHVQGRLRYYSAEGTEVHLKRETPLERIFLGYSRLSDGVAVRWRFPTGQIATENWRFDRRRIVHEYTDGPEFIDLPAANPATKFDSFTSTDPGRLEGSLERPGYRAIAYPRPKTPSGEDLLMPGAIAVHPKNGRVFVASMRIGEIFKLHDPDGSGKRATFENFTNGLYQECYSMLAEEDGLYVLHRRNLSRVDYKGERVDRVALLPHGIGETYDYAYGLAKDKAGAFIYTYAPHANKELKGSGSALRLAQGKEPTEVAFGFRNPVGWCAGPNGEIFFSDNQGEWIATNKLAHLAPGRFYGYPNSAQKQHTTKPKGDAAVWVPYAWARSINGIAYDNTKGKFGPFAGQIFLSELMYGGAIVRANLEKIDGEYQGACFPFWGKGLLGPVTLAFDPSRGPLYVGSITEPGWMAQPDRGALFRIDFTGAMPFEIQSIHARPKGFQLRFTKAVDVESARKLASYAVEHYRYEFTGAYGSPELDRTKADPTAVDVGKDGMTVELTLPALIRERVYMVNAGGVRSKSGESLVHPAGAYTLNRVPR